MTYIRALSAIAIALSMGLSEASAQTAATATEPRTEEPAMNIIEHISIGTDNEIILPEALRELLNYNKDGNEDNKSKNSRVGYRVQVFSDNNARTAKNEARSKSRSITERFPDYPAYVIFSSPYWRLRVGDFRTQEEAREAAEEIRKAFPAFGKEIHVVRDRINIR